MFYLKLWIRKEMVGYGIACFVMSVFGDRPFGAVPLTRSPVSSHSFPAIA
jgi:hypothetical protein